MEVHKYPNVYCVSSSDHKLIQMHFENTFTEDRKNEVRDLKNCNNKLFRQKIIEKRNINRTYKIKMDRAMNSSNKMLHKTEDINYNCNYHAVNFKQLFEESCPMKKVIRKGNPGFWDKSPQINDGKKENRRRKNPCQSWEIRLLKCKSIQNNNTV